MIGDPVERGRTLGAFYLRLEASLWQDIVQSGLLVEDEVLSARPEWACFALHACVRGLVATGGFGEENMRAVDTLHDAVSDSWDGAGAEPDALGVLRERIAARYEGYGEIARTHAAHGNDAVVAKLGEAAARHLSGTDIANAELGLMLGELYEAIAQGAAESVREPGA